MIGNESRGIGSRGSGRRILVVRPDRIGDVVLSTPLIRALRKSFPDAYIAALLRTATQEVLFNNPYLDEIVAYDPDGVHSGRSGFWKMVTTLHRSRFDTALLLLPNERIAWMLFLAGIPRRIGVGYKLYEMLTLMRTVSRRKYIPLRHEADYCLDLGRAIGARPDGLETEVFLTQEERDTAHRFLQALGVPFDTQKVGIHAGSGGSSPNWPPEEYAALAARLIGSDPGVSIVLTGPESERRFAAALESLPKERVFPAYVTPPQPIRRLAGIISHLDLFVSASTGPMHIAAGLGVPTVSLFCPLPACSPILWGPQGSVNRIITPDPPHCLTAQSPVDPKQCRFEGIEVKRVASAVAELLESHA